MELSVRKASRSDAPRPRSRAAVDRLGAVWRHPTRRGTAIALLAAALSAAAFARVTEDYLTDDPLARWDVSFARWLSDHRSTAGTEVFRSVTDIGSPVAWLLAAAVVAVLLLRRRRVADAALLPFVLAGAEVLNLGLKVVFHRQRPGVGFVHLDTYSYPSGHAMIATAACGAFAYLSWQRLSTRRRRLLMLGGMTAIVVLIGFSRLYLGVHYLSDVLGGIAAGAAWLGVAIAVRLALGERLATWLEDRRLARS